MNPDEMIQTGKRYLRMLSRRDKRNQQKGGRWFILRHVGTLGARVETCEENVDLWG